MATVTSPIILDSTGQDIKDSIDLLTANINRTASNIPYDNNLTIKGKIDSIPVLQYEDITGTTDANGYIIVSSSVATVDNFISAFVLEPRRHVVTWWVTDVGDTRVILKIMARTDNVTPLASSSVKIRIWHI